MLIDVEIIIFMKIVADIHVGIAIEINVGNTNSQAITNYGTIDAGFFGYFSKFSIAIIAIEMISRYCTAVASICWRGPNVPF